MQPSTVRSLTSDFQPYGPGNLRPRRVVFDPADPAHLSRDETGRLHFRVLAPFDVAEAMVVLRTDGVNGHELRRIGAAGSVSLWEAIVERPPRRFEFSIALRLGDGDAVYWTPTGIANGIERLDRFPVATSEVPVPAVPPWVQGAVIYQIFPDRFARAAPAAAGLDAWDAVPAPQSRLGGDLRGIRDHIPHLVDLGVDVVYLNPIFTSPSNHRYDTVDYRTVDPALGGNDALAELVAALHAAGIRIILDTSLNHCHPRFFAFADIVANGPASPYAGWFDVKEWPVRVRVRPHVISGSEHWRARLDRLERESGVPIEIAHDDGPPLEPTYGAWYGVPLMPRIDLADRNARRYMLDTATYWVREFGIDGWRMDVVRYVDHDFWGEFRREVRAVDREAYLLAEVMGEARRWLQGDEFDGVMNYVFRDLVVDFVALRRITADEFVAGLLELGAMYAPAAAAATQNLLGSHDTPRFVTVADGNRRALHLAMLLQMTLPGAPGVYYGDEVAMEGGPDPDNRRGMAWESVGGRFFDRVRSLMALRRTARPLRHGDWRVLTTGRSVLAYERVAGRERNVIVLNVGEHPERLPGLDVTSVRWSAGDVAIDGACVLTGPDSGAVLR